MKKNHYSISRKVFMAVLQGAFAGVLAVCLLIVSYWLDGTYQISMLGRSYEETAVFLRDTETAIRRKVDYSRNLTTFQTAGVTDLNKEIDIRQYVSGINDSANRNENLTYLLSDLINFYPESGALMAAVESAASLEPVPSVSGMGTWEALAGAASGCELILPISGKSLAETARASSTPFETLLEYYQSLLRTSSELHSRYRTYVDETEKAGGAGSPDAPSNISYYIENTQTKESYTNLGVRSVATARQAVTEDPELTFLFDGVRTMDIMVANTENTLNQQAASWFIDTIFVGSNERVVIAVDRSYTVGDQLHEDYLAYQKRGPVVLACLLTALASLIFLIALFIWSIRMTGRSGPDTLIELRGFDLVPTEIAAGLCVAGGLAWYYIARAALRRLVPLRFQPAGRVIFLIVLYEFALLAVLSLARRIKWDRLWHNSVTYTVVRVSAQVLEARAASTRLLFIYIGFILLNFLFLRFFGHFGVAIVIVLDLALLLYLMRDRLGKLSVRAGLRELSKGKLDYKIDTSSLTGDSLEMAEAVNEMGDGLQEAVDSIVRSERLKAELITNVSHDLKTPLTSIINYVDLLKRQDLKDEKAREYIDVLDRKSQRLKSLISDLIDASKINSGMIELDMTLLDLRSMVRMAVGEFDDRFSLAGLKTEFTEQEPGRKLMIRADGSQLWRVLDNLLSNISKYARSGSVVRVSLSCGDGHAEASFENESAEELKKSGEELEERFVRGDLSRNSEGSGLGLSIAGSLTELMGGKFSVTTSPHLFRAVLRFPLAEEEKGQAGSPQGQQKPGRPKERQQAGAEKEKLPEGPAKGKQR